MKPTAFEESQKKQTSSAGRWWGKSVVYGKEAEHATPMMTRFWIGRLRLHIFHRGDQDPDCHDHPWDFWTFPLTPYVEEVAGKVGKSYDALGEHSICGTSRQVVPAWRWTFRPAEHTHRVLGRWNGTWGRHYPPGFFADDPSRWELSGPHVDDGGALITIVWRSKVKRAWGFLKNRHGRWCWIAWREYVFGGGKSAPCE